VAECRVVVEDAPREHNSGRLETARRVAVGECAVGFVKIRIIDRHLRKIAVDGDKPGGDQFFFEMVRKAGPRDRREGENSEQAPEHSAQLFLGIHPELFHSERKLLVDHLHINLFSAKDGIPGAARLSTAVFLFAPRCDSFLD
jgi:hypothetical protein